MPIPGASGTTKNPSLHSGITFTISEARNADFPVLSNTKRAWAAGPSGSGYSWMVKLGVAASNWMQAAVATGLKGLWGMMPIWFA